MKIYIYTLFILLTAFSNLIAQDDVQGTVIVENAYIASVYIKSVNPIEGPNASNNIVSFNACVSIDAGGASDVSNAPVVNVSNNLVNVSFSSVDLINGRYVYTFAGNQGLNMFSYPANVDLKLLDVNFPSDMTLDPLFPRLEDHANNGGGPSFQSYFYFDINGVDKTMYSDYFYGPGTEGVYGVGDPYYEPLTALPIKLNSFTAAKYEDLSSKLDWTTSTEVNGSHFEIERSDDTHNWNKIGTVQAVGESYDNINYEYIDQNVGILRSATTYYYRLKMVDNDGTFEYSDVRSVSFDQDGIDVSVYPNPVTDKLTVNVSSEDNDEAEMIIFDSSGKILMKNKISSNGITEIDVNNVPSGVILMKVVKNNSVYTKRIIKVD